MDTKIRLYFYDKIKSDLVAQLNKEQSHYIKNVMRLKVGDSFLIFNIQGEWQVVIKNFESKKVFIKVLDKLRNEAVSKNLWLAFSPIRQNLLNFMIQKTTELGVENFIPIISERSITKELNTERMKKIFIESSEQSNRLNVPKIISPIKLKNFLLEFPKNGILIFCDLNSSKNDLNKILLRKKQGPICVLIGPEGDFTEKERKYILSFDQSHSISLGQNILRTETAAIAAVSIVSFQL